MLKFLRDLGESFLFAALVVAAVDAPALIEAGTWEQFAAVGLALARASVIAGLKAVLPKLIALRDSRSS